MALTEPRVGWLRRNRLWLVLLVPLVALALLASSWQWWTIYRPNKQSIAHRPSNGVVHLEQTLLVKDTERPLVVDISASEAVRMGAVGGHQAPDGMALYQVTVTYAADPNQPLVLGCGVMIRDEQEAVYASDTGTVPVPGAKQEDMADGCLPSGHSGPTYDLLSGGVTPPDEGEERPPNWVLNYLFVLPVDRTPDELRIVFDLPDYAVFDLRG